ncbi:MAG: hypothetical protein L0220_22805, partial [Acidobacteria bacterium]|nr:hypothetical protein [Acidobacteriota bacterium]
MNNDVEIIPVESSEIDKSLTALVEARREILPKLPGMGVDDLRAVYRWFYKKAEAEHWLTIINLVIRQSDTVRDNKTVWHKSIPGGLTVEASYDPAAGSTVVVVSGLQVFSNDRAGLEVCIPGQWMHVMRDAYTQALLHREWELGLQTEKVKGDLISDFSKEV